MLKTLLLVPALIFLLLLSASVPTGFAQTPAPAPTQPAGVKNPVKPTPALQEKAKKLYAQDCAICHGDNGNGKTDVATGMQLTLSDWTTPAALASKSDELLFNTIRNGKDKMPAEAEGRAKNDELWHLILYIRSLSKGQATAPDAKPVTP